MAVAATAKATEKKREFKFSDAELRVLLKLIKEHNVLLFGTLDGTAVAAKKKGKMWEHITASGKAPYRIHAGRV